jgi:hypothetical protein
MQLQIEYNPVPALQESCLICNEQFEMTEARIIACNEQGKSYGDVCPQCLEKGFNWLNQQFQQLNQPKRNVSIRKTQPVQVPVGI